jgi:hypothetical protein
MTPARRSQVWITLLFALLSFNIGDWPDHGWRLIFQHAWNIGIVAGLWYVLWDEVAAKKRSRASRAK